MTIEEDIEAFRLWASNMGFPPSALPNEEALKSVFKSRQRDLFYEMMQRVRPKQEVEEIRMNILISKIKKLKNQVIPSSSYSSLPKEIQIHLKAKDALKKKEAAELRFAETKKQYESLAAEITKRNIQLLQMEKKKETLQARVTLLEFKSESLEKAIAEEKRNQEKILSAMPVKLNEKNSSEEAAMEAVKKALKELEQFYNVFYNDSNSQTQEEAKRELWQKMRTIFANVPNFLIFNAIMRLKDEQLQYIMSLNKTELNATQTSSENNATSKEGFSPFEMKLMKMKAHLMGLVAKYLTARNERIALEERFTRAYGPFVEKLKNKIGLSNTEELDETTEQIISNYIVQYNLRNFSKAQNEFLAVEIEKLKAEIADDRKQLENHEVLLSSLKEVYTNINTSVNRIQYEMVQLNQIKEKILYSKNMMQHLMNDMNTATVATTSKKVAKSNFLSTKLMVNTNASMMGGDSFEMGNDNVFCSTKLDFDNTITSLNNTARGYNPTTADTTIMPMASANTERNNCIVPPYLAELNTFAETPMEKFSCITKECAYYLSPNPIVLYSNEDISDIQMAPGVLLTSFGAMQEVRKRFMWADLIAQHSNKLKLNLEKIFVDKQALTDKSKHERERIKELLDKINACNANTDYTLQKINKLYDFIMENPLRHYIPDTRRWKNRTYSEYEAEFEMYYRMVQHGDSIK